MPLTYDDREDLYIEIMRLRSVCECLEMERDSLKKECDILRYQLRAASVVCSVLGGK
jgi:hypothetical protein